MKKCKICGKRFAPYSSLAKVCSPGCAIVLVNKDKAAKAQQQRQAERMARGMLC